MKVLLLGDFSSFHKYLKDGLIQNGAEVTLVSSGDGWKKIAGADYPLYLSPKKSKNKIIKIYKLYKASIRTYKELDSYDVIQLINPRIFHPLFNYALIKKYIKKAKLRSLTCCGNDLALYNAYTDGNFEYYMFDGDCDMAKVYEMTNPLGFLTRITEPKILKLMDVIIPTSYVYEIGYKEDDRQINVIPMPINVDDIVYKDNIVKDKIVIYHGITREGAKGTKLICEALDRIKKKYSGDVEVIVSGKMPFNEYVKVIDRANIVVDQCRSYGYGINACIAMAKGKVVLSGARKEILDSLNINECPVFGIQPDVDIIYEQLEYIILNRTQIVKWGQESRKYVEKVHDYKIIAKKYLKVWSDLLHE